MLFLEIQLRKNLKYGASQLTIYLFRLIEQIEHYNY